MTESTELVVIEKENTLGVFTKPEVIDDLLAKIKNEIESFVPDISTAKGRKEVKAMVTKITKSKTYIETKGKELSAEYKAIPKNIDAGRKKIKDTLDLWKTELRQPLTDWEEKEKAKVAKIQEMFSAMQRLSQAFNEDDTQKTSAELTANLAKLEGFSLDEETWGDKLSEALIEHKTCSGVISTYITRAENDEAEKAELESLRKEKELQEQKARDAKIAKEAEEKAKREFQEELERVEAEKVKAVEDAKLAEEKAKAEAVEARQKAEREAKESKEKAEKEVELARLRERDRIAGENRKKEEAQAKRNADIEHKTKINRAIVSALVETGASEAHAKKIVVAILNGEIPNVKLAY